MKQKFFLLLALILAVAHGWAATDMNDSTMLQSELFFAQVGNSDSKIVTANFVTDGIVPDPDEPIIMSNGNGTSLQAGRPNYYSVSIEGADSIVFNAVITNATFGSCSVCVTYTPNAIGTHSATLKVKNLVSSSNASVQIRLVGVAKPLSNDRHPQQTTGVDLSKIPNGLVQADVNKPNSPEDLEDINSKTTFALDIISLILEHAPIIYLRPVDESEDFVDVPVGTTATKHLKCVLSTISVKQF